MCFPWALARLLPSAVRVRIRSRSTSASPPSTASIKRPVLVQVSAHGSAKERNCALASTMRLTMANRSKVLRGQSASPSPRRRGPACRDVPAAASRRAKLVELGVKGLPVGRDAGIADKPFFGVSFGHILCKP